MDEQAKEQLINFVEDMNHASSRLDSLLESIEENELKIKMLVQDINVYSSDFLYEIYGVKIETEYPE